MFREIVICLFSGTLHHYILNFLGSSFRYGFRLFKYMLRSPVRGSLYLRFLIGSIPIGVREDEIYGTEHDHNQPYCNQHPEREELPARQYVHIYEHEAERQDSRCNKAYKRTTHLHVLDAHITMGEVTCHEPTSRKDNSKNIVFLKRNLC